MTTAMGKTRARVATAATLIALYAAWHLTGSMHGTVVHLHTPSAMADVTTSALVTSQCQNLPLSPTPSPSPSGATANTGQLCVSVQAAQDSIRSGKTASWIIEVQVKGGSATSVAVTLATIPSGPVPVFTGSCPSGGGTTSCIVGDIGTAVTPAIYQLQAQVAVPADTGAGTLALIASADTSPIMASIPAAGQTITITPTPGAKPTPAAPGSKPTPGRTAAPASAATQPATTPATAPAIAPLSAAAQPTAAAQTTTIPPGSISGVLPQITPAATTTPAIAIAATPATANIDSAPATTSIDSSPAANIQAIGPIPTATTGADSFTLSIGMSARTAEILSVIFLALIFTLTTTRLISGYLTTRRHASQKPEPDRSRVPQMRLPRLHLLRPLSRLHLQRLRFRPTAARAERRATREQNWQRHLDSQQTPPPLEISPAASATVQSVEHLD